MKVVFVFLVGEGQTKTQLAHCMVLEITSSVEGSAMIPQMSMVADLTRCEDESDDRLCSGKLPHRSNVMKDISKLGIASEIL